MGKNKMEKIRLHKSMVPESLDIQDILETGMVSNWKYVKMLEEKLKEVHKVNHALCFNSCTSALSLLLHILKPKTVGTPSFTWSSPKHVLNMLSIETIYMDIDEKTWVVNEEEQKRINDKVDLFMLTAAFGNKPNVLYPEKTIIDSAACGGHEGFGKLAIAEVISFAPSKTFTGIEGGAILTNNDKVAEELRKVQHYMSRMGEINAKIALYNYERRKEIFEWKKKLYEEYKKGLPFCTFQETNSYNTLNEIACIINGWNEVQWNKLSLLMETRKRYDPEYENHKETGTSAIKIYKDIISLPSYLGADYQKVIQVMNEINDEKYGYDFTKREKILNEMFGENIKKVIRHDAKEYNLELEENKNDVNKFYENTQLFLLASCDKGHVMPRIKIAQNLCQYFKENNIKKIVDLGAGGGIYSEIFIKAGFNVTIVDKKDSKTLQFLKNYFNGEVIYSLEEFLEFWAKYDAVVAFDFFEHFEEPEKVINKIKTMTNTIIESTHFGDKDYKMHFKNNKTMINYLGDQFMKRKDNKDYTLWVRKDAV